LTAKGKAIYWIQEATDVPDSTKPYAITKGTNENTNENFEQKKMKISIEIFTKN